MAEPKTKATEASVDAFLDAISDPQRRDDCRAIAGIMRKATKVEPKMWGGAIVGFGRYTYAYESGQKGEWPVVGFSPRKNEISLYLMPGVEAFADLLPQLGKYKTGKSCLYVKRLADVDQKVLAKCVAASVKAMAKSRVE